MPGQTTDWNLRFPLYTDPDDAATNIKNLADDVNGALVGLQASLATAQVKLRAQIARTVSIAVPNNAFTNMTFLTEQFDNDNMANLGVDNTALTINTAGFYFIQARAIWNTNATGERSIRLTSTTRTPPLSEFREAAVTGNSTNPNIGRVAWCTVGTVLRVQLFQNSGAALNASFASFSATRLAG